MLNYILIILHFILEKLLKLFLLIRIRVKIHHFCADKAEYFSYSDQNVPRIQNKLVVTFPKENIDIRPFSARSYYRLPDETVTDHHAAGGRNAEDRMAVLC